MPVISLQISYRSFITFSWFLWNLEHSCIIAILNIFSNITKSHSLNICISFWTRVKSGNNGHIFKKPCNYKKPVNLFFLLSFEGESWQSLKTEHPSFAEKDLSECSVSQEGLIWCNCFLASFLEPSSCQGFAFSSQMLVSHSALFCTLII